MTIDRLAIVYLSSSEFIRHWDFNDSECEFFASHVESFRNRFELLACPQIGCIDPFVCSGFIDESKRFNFCFDFFDDFNVLIMFFLISCDLFFRKLCLCCSSSLACVFFCCVFVSCFVPDSSCFRPCVRNMKIISKDYHCSCEFFPDPLHLGKLFIDSKIDNCFIEFQTLPLVLNRVGYLLQSSIKPESFSHFLN